MVGAYTLSELMHHCASYSIVAGSLQPKNISLSKRMLQLTNESVSKLYFNIDVTGNADAGYLAENAVTGAYVQNALVNAQFPRFPVASASAAVHAVAAGRLHHGNTQLFRRHGYRSGYGYAELL